jgi:4-amino-4-deoxy-L-arabinose transferase-like glycosyltransferase
LIDLRRHASVGLPTIVVCLVVYFVARLVFFDASYFVWDEAVYILNAYAILGQNYYNELISRPPLISLLLVPLLWFSKSDAVIKLFAIFLNAPAILAVYLLGREVDAKVGVLSALLLAVFPFHILASRWVLTDAPSIIFLTLFMLYQYRGLRDRRRIDCLLSGVFFGLAVLTKFTIIYSAIMSLPLLVYFRRGNIGNIFYMGLGSVLLLSPYLAWNYLMFNDPLKSFVNASFVLWLSQPVSAQFIAWTIADLYGPFSIGLLALGAYLAIRRRNGYLMFQLYCFVATFLLYLLVIESGVAKPPDTVWEVERYALPTMPFALVIIAYAITTIPKYGKVVAKRLKPKILVTLVLAIILLSSVPSYQRAYTPTIDFENGLRRATKEMGLWINQHTPIDSVIYCSVNYPPIAYYAQRSTRFFPFNTKGAWDMLSNGSYLVILSGPRHGESPTLSESLAHGLRVIITIHDIGWNITLLQT